MEKVVDTVFFLENSDLQWTEFFFYCNIMDRFGKGKSTAMYIMDEEYIMLGFSVEKMCYWYFKTAIVLPVTKF